jgi:hypothetical protein
MKKITLLVFGIIAIFTLTLQAQDLGVVMVSPANGTTYTTTSNVTLTFTLQNVGPASLTNGDTVFFELSGNGTPLLTVYLPLGANTLAAGQAANVSMPNPIQIPVTGTNMPVCISITRSTLGTDPVTPNNQSCVNITVTGNGIEESAENIKISVFPNPFANDLSVECEKEIENISMFNALGQIVFDSKVNNTSMQMNTASYEEGIYFIQIKTHSGISTKKVILKK